MCVSIHDYIFLSSYGKQTKTLIDCLWNIFIIYIWSFGIDYTSSITFTSMEYEMKKIFIVNCNHTIHVISNKNAIN